MILCAHCEYLPRAADSDYCEKCDAMLMRELVEECAARTRKGELPLYERIGTLKPVERVETRGEFI